MPDGSSIDNRHGQTRINMNRYDWTWIDIDKHGQTKIDMGRQGYTCRLQRHEYTCRDMDRHGYL